MGGDCDYRWGVVYAVCQVGSDVKCQAGEGWI